MNNPNFRSRWSALADELGLASEPEPVVAKAPPVVEEKPVEAAPVEPIAIEVPAAPEAEPVRGRKRRAAVTEETVVEAAPQEAVVEEAAVEIVAEEAAEPVTAEGGEETPAQAERRRGRRRGRRGRGRRAEGTEPETAEKDTKAEEAGVPLELADSAPGITEVAEHEPIVVEELPGDEVPLKMIPEEAEQPVGEEDKPKDKERGRRRGRGRGRKTSRSDEAPNEAPEDETTIAETITTEAPEDDDGDTEDVSGWEVPSWNELIAGLYRPDR